MIVQITIIELQKFLGGKFILPKFLRNKPYNYYVDFDTIINKINVIKKEKIIYLIEKFIF